jgi:hypothetical protein
MKQILKDAFKSSEMQHHLQAVIAVDDKIAVEAIPDKTVVSEAKYVLGKFTDASGGFEQAEELNGERGPEQQAWAKKEVAALKSFLKKYDDAGVKHEVAKTKPLAPGMVVCYRNTAYKLERPAGPRRGWIANRVQDGKQFRLKCRQLAAASSNP